MGEFESGRWIIGISLYYFVLFLIVFVVGHSLTAAEVDDDDLSNIDNVFGASQPSPDSVVPINYTDSQASGSLNFDVVSDTFSVITGIGSASFSIGLPVDFLWIFNFIFFWIPFAILLYAIYMALPFLH